MVRLNRIYTRTGDDGTTGLGNGQRRAKFDPRVAAYGEVDETNSAIGLARVVTAASSDPDLQAIDAMLAARNESGTGIALIDPNGLVVQATARARSAGLSEGEPLPWPLRQLLTTRSRRQQLSLGDAPLSAELIVNIGPGLHAIRLTPAERQPVAAALRGLGLTPRQAEILALIARAQTTGQIAVQLNISPRTVEKHLEAVYERLGVTNRSQAIIRALNLAPGE